MQLHDRGVFEVHAIDHAVNAIRIAAQAGVHAAADVFYRVDYNGRVLWVVSRTCDHANGKLRIDADGMTATCPMHGWRLSLDTLCYENVQVCKKTLEFKQDGDLLEYRLPKSSLRFPPGLALGQPVCATVRFLAHACVEIQVGGVSIVTDPWLVGPCFTTGWWHSVIPPDDALDVMARADLVYLSHNHPDHMHRETLRHLDRGKPVIVPNFESDSAASIMRGWGFRDVRALDFGQIFEIGESGVFLSMLRAGDFRDDSGLVVANGDFTAILTVDSNRLNQFVLPERPSILLSSFAGGATGYPLCFEVYEQKEKDVIVTRNRNAMLSAVDEYVLACNPRAYMPYAGYFAERAPRDRYIRKHNRKNSAADVITYVTRKHQDLLGIDPTVTDIATWKNGAFTAAASQRKPLAEVDPAFVAHWISRIDVPRSDYDADRIAEYFSASGFQDDLILYLVPTDDDFVPIEDVDGHVIDFRGSKPVVSLVRAAEADRLYERDAQSDSGSPRRKRLRVRIGSLMRAIKNGLPLEDILIGFQCRVHRAPDVYNSRFWFHFTNSYIGEKTCA